ncbi:MAG TPA: 4-(cytidine 5'-diphospho)-2-C-methyl-D-erythritol kinase [bacterium]|nr:4-(cytidine 5'-diphospho)-2-C-methyl-D-erythritol kinase [bacterium]
MMTQHNDLQCWRRSAHAKLNLFLSVQNKRADGFHDILAVNQEISLSDSLVFTPEPARFTVSVQGNPDVPSDERNLVYKAAKALFADDALPKMRVCVEKTIPTGAGLGGGSSDAAATLSFFNSHFGINKPLDELIAIAKSVGSDVPFALMGGTALVSGVGEKIQRLPEPQEPVWFVVAAPTVSVSTGHAYRWIDEQQDRTPAPQPDQLIHSLLDRDLESLARHLHNDFEQVILKRHPQIGNLKQALLDAGALGALMTGSGSNVFAVVRSQDHAELVKRRITGCCSACWVAHSVPFSAR